MFSTLKQLLGFGPKTDYAELKRNGAIILDVRSKSEFADGHIKNSINIPVDTLPQNLNKLKNKNTPIITCCATGNRSGMAKRILQSKGYEKVYNGGGWKSLNKKISDI